MLLAFHMYNIQRPTCRNNKNWTRNQFGRPMILTLCSFFLVVYWFCVSENFLLYLAKAKYHCWPLHASRKIVIIDKYTKEHLTLTSKFDLDFWPWPQYRLKGNKTFDLKFKATRDLELWPWLRELTLTFDLDLKSRSKTTKRWHQNRNKNNFWLFDFDLRPWPTIPA